MQALLANTCPHQVPAFSASQHQHIWNVRAALTYTTPEHFRSDNTAYLFGMQYAQPSHLRRRAPLGAQQQSGSSLPGQSLCLTASRSKQLHISHATPRQSTKETDHRYAVENNHLFGQAGVPVSALFSSISSIPATEQLQAESASHDLDYAPQKLFKYRRFTIPLVHRSAEGADSQEGGMNSQTLGIIALAGGLAVVLGLGYLFKGKIRHFLDYFIERVDEWGPWGYVAYGALYTLLEVLALPAIPLTMTSGVLFGIVPGTIVVSGASTLAATIAFLIARYAARDKASDLGGLQALHSQTQVVLAIHLPILDRV